MVLKLNREDIGYNIQKIAKIILCIGILLALISLSISAFQLLHNINDLGNSNTNLRLSNIILLKGATYYYIIEILASICAIFFSVIISFVLYGFGQLIINSNEQLSTQNEIAEKVYRINAVENNTVDTIKDLD